MGQWRFDVAGCYQIKQDESEVCAGSSPRETLVAFGADWVAGPSRKPHPA